MLEDREMQEMFATFVGSTERMAIERRILPQDRATRFEVSLLDKDG